MPSGKVIRVGSTNIPGGMLYVGKGLASGSFEFQVEATLIDPALKVAGHPDLSGEQMGYWPSYSSIAPSCRAAYLQWLQGGRRDPDVGIGYVFLFFYGLERRLLVDPRLVSVPFDEWNAILAEVRRLQALYPDNRSFQGYSQAFLGFFPTHGDDRPLYQSPPPILVRRGDWPSVLRIGLGQLVRDGLPIPPHWAFSWVVHDRETRLRTPANRCATEFEQLFAIRYQQEFGDGMVLQPSRRRLVIRYQAASPSIRRAVTREYEDLSDVCAMAAPLDRLRRILERCMDDLSPYSRWLGRNPDLSDSLQAAAMLPADLVVAAPRPGMDELKAWLRTTVGTADRVAADATELLRWWPASRDGKYRKADAVGLAQLLGKVGVGIEPDMRFGGPRPDKVEKMVLFPEKGEPMGAISPAYQAAAASMRLAAAVATADDVVTPEEQRSLEGQLESSPLLTDGERVRLRAHVEWLLAERPKLTGLKKKLEALKQEDRAAVGELLVQIAVADGRIEPSEVTTLKKLYRMLGLDPEQVYSRLHAVAAGGDPPAAAPVTVRQAEQPRSFSIPRPAVEEQQPQLGPAVQLDPALIEAKLVEARKASRLLASIFEDDEDEVELEPDVDEACGEDVVEGLDLAHSRFLRELMTRDEWERDDVEALADAMGLLTDGALETINDVAWERADDPLFDGDDPIEVNREVLEEMMT